MMPTTWKSFGASVTGPSHVATGKPNQDAWSAFEHSWGYGIAVADGLGSKPHSDWGSRAACRAVEASASRLWTDHRHPMLQSHSSELLPGIVEEWLFAIDPFVEKDCAATCLYAITSPDDQIHLGMLGDGAAVAVLQDGSVIVLSDSKDEGFSNLTNALSATTTLNHWRVRSVVASECAAVLLCTDGVADDVEDLAGFARGFVKAYEGLGSLAASRRAWEMLSTWPVPKHSDDKTLACLINVVTPDE